MGNCVELHKKHHTHHNGNLPRLRLGNEGAYADNYVARSFALEKDDEVLPPLQTQFADRAPYVIEASLNFGWDCFKPKKSDHHDIPCAVIITAPDQPIDQRVGVDLICVIDISGSMAEEQKLYLVIKTMNFMIAQLTAIDRLCIISFNNSATKLMPLTVMNDRGKAFAASVANHLVAGGGTNIVEGLRYALTVALMRNMMNYTLDILILSDGEDNDQASSLYRTRDCFAMFDQYNMAYSVHAFGYGEDHDSELLGEIAHIKNGAFYYIEQPEDIQHSFSHCLGEILSVVARNVQVNLSTLPCPIPFSLTKVHSECGTMNFRLPNISSGTTKEAVFILSFPPYEVEVQDCTMTPAKAIITFQTVGNGEIVTLERVLTIQINNTKQSVEFYKGVMLHFYRVRGAEILKNAGALGEQGRFDEAMDLLNEGLHELKKSEYHNDPMIKLLIKDIDRSKNKVKHQGTWERGGHAHFRHLHHAHWAKRGDDLYLNAMQKNIKLQSQNFF